MLQSIKEFINFWWFRYLLVTELYICETWERVTIHVIFAVLFALIWYFNAHVTLPATQHLLGSFTGSGLTKDAHSIGDIAA